MREAARGFESLLIEMLMRQMRRSVPENGILSEGQGGKIFRSLLDREFARRAAGARGLGIAEMVHRQFSKGGRNVGNEPAPGLSGTPVKDHGRSVDFLG